MRNEILKAATRLFAAHGFDGTSLKDISEVVGIRKPSLLYHFESKEKLRLAVLQSILERWHEVVPRLLSATSGGQPRFETIIQETVAFFASDVDRARLLLREILDRPDAMRVSLREYVRPWLGVVADYIRTGQKHGQVHPDTDPEAYILQVINLVVAGLAVTSRVAEAVLPAGEGDASPTLRNTHEIIRIAHHSLFLPRRTTSNAPSHASNAPSTEAPS